jgi:hypothetical protein
MFSAIRWRAIRHGRSLRPRQPQGEEAADEGAPTGGADTEPYAKVGHYLWLLSSAVRRLDFRLSTIAPPSSKARRLALSGD